MASLFIWNSFTEHPTDQKKEATKTVAVNELTAAFLVTASNILLFRRTGISYINRFLSPPLLEEFNEKINNFCKTFGTDWRNCMMFLTCYEFSPQLEKVLLDIRNVIKGTLLLMKLLPTETSNNLATDSVIHPDVKELLRNPLMERYTRITTFDLGCSSYAESEFAYQLTSQTNIDINTHPVMADDRFDFFLTHIYSAFIHLNSHRLKPDEKLTAPLEQAILDAIHKKQSNFYEYSEPISNKIYFNLFGEYVLPKYCKLWTKQ
ncbi:MAG: hypothetical protein Hyperionvirus1_43 [Hyperionvirus sp.]|uniref:Uncharacterized protein n=1 Tax=Hyperionvirus sp. TaxID=2487770 RepID=A0A3G5A7H8_9VIRU|nr:MAG: hypothetical protein Hyperionvirus1_43 [Hyperionvirus sp.]